MQTPTANSLVWAEKEPFIDCDEAFIPSLAERMSFVGLQPVSGSFPFFFSIFFFFPLKHNELRRFGSVTFFDGYHLCDA